LLTLRCVSHFLLASSLLPVYLLLPCTFVSTPHCCYSQTLQRIRSSIARLGVTTLDMVQLHWEPPPQQQAPNSNRIQGFVAAAKALQQLQQRGLVRAIGVSNFDQRMLMALLDAGVKPVSNQVSGLCLFMALHSFFAGKAAFGAAASAATATYPCCCTCRRSAILWWTDGCCWRLLLASCDPML
jgi:hypothetical protein